MLKKKNKFNVGIISTVANRYLLSFEKIWLRELVGKNPPLEIIVIDRLSELNNLKLPKFKIIKISIVKIE